MAATKTIAKKTNRIKRANATKRDESAPAASAATIDRRAGDRRSKSERREHSEPVAVERRALERRVKVNRRRQIDPTTCERDYTPDEIEFMGALDDYKRRSGRMFPTCSEVLEVIRGLGYEKRTAAPAQPATTSGEAASTAASA